MFFANALLHQLIPTTEQTMRLLAIVTLFLVALQATAQDKYAVVVGVETYDTGTFDPLEFANEDARDLGTVLTSLGFTTKVITSDAVSSTLRPSTPQKILTTMKTVSNSCGPDDTLVISLSGHGVQFADEELLPTGVRETYFCPEDATLNDKESLLKISTVVEYMAQSQASSKLLLVDSCRENVLSQQGRRKATRRIELGSVHENRQSVPSGMAVLFSCSSKQFSWEHEELGHSVFTNYVIDYLDGKAEGQFYEGGAVGLDGLVYYVRKRTNDYVFSKNLSPDGQLPVLRGDSTNWLFGTVNLDPSTAVVNQMGPSTKVIADPQDSSMAGQDQLRGELNIARVSVFEAEAKVQAAESKKQIAEQAFSRAARLHDVNAISQKEYEEAKQQSEIANDRLKAAAEKLETARSAVRRIESSLGDESTPIKSSRQP